MSGPSRDTQIDLLREQVGASGSSTVSTEQLADYFDTAVEQLDDYLADLDPETEIPPRTLARAYRAVAAELFNQDQAPNGFLNQQGLGPDGVGSVVRVGTDPLRPAYALLGRRVSPVTFS